MLLVVAATEIEMKPFRTLCRLPADRLTLCLSGVGPVEAAVTVTRLLDRCRGRLAAVVNFGIAGAYLAPPVGDGAECGDICLARREVLGDYGVCLGERIEPFKDASLAAPRSFDLDRTLLARAESILTAHGQPHRTGTFVTVNGASGSAARGEFLRRRYRALCENMEGAAIARACRAVDIALLEVRAVSNLVEDRPGAPWHVQEACARAARAAALIVHGLQENS